MKTIYIIAYRTFNSMKMERQKMWAYMRWLRWHMDRNPDFGYFLFAEEFFEKTRK